MIVRWMPGTPSSKGRSRPLAEGVYLGTFASASVDASAVKRNRMRRRCREALRLAIEKLPERSSVQLLVSPKAASLDAPFDALRREADAFFSHLRS
jgi:ribonuclease P protein component